MRHRLCALAQQRLHCEEMNWRLGRLITIGARRVRAIDEHQSMTAANLMMIVKNCIEPQLAPHVSPKVDLHHS